MPNYFVIVEGEDLETYKALPFDNVRMAMMAFFRERKKVSGRVKITRPDGHELNACEIYRLLKVENTGLARDGST